LSKGRILYVGLMAAMIAALYLVRAYAGDPNPGHHEIIHALFSL
jgi:hypothetical protein